MKYIRGKTIATLFVVGLLILAFGSFVSNRKHVARTNTKDLHSNIIQNITTLDSVNFIDESAPLSGEQHKAVATKLEQNIKAVENSLNKSDKYQQVELRKLVSQEKITLSNYNQLINSLYKVISYNPVDDLESLPNDKQDQLRERALAARNGIGSVLNKSISKDELTITEDKIKLDDKTIEALRKSKDCFDQISTGQTDKAGCSKGYATTRQSANQYLKNIWISDESALNLKHRLQELSRSL